MPPTYQVVEACEPFTGVTLEIDPGLGYSNLEDETRNTVGKVPSLGIDSPIQLLLRCFMHMH